MITDMAWTLGGDRKSLATYEARLNLNRVWKRHAALVYVISTCRSSRPRRCAR